MGFCSVFKNGLFWLGVFYVVSGVWVLGESFDLGPFLNHMEISGTLLLPVGVVFIIVAMKICCSDKTQ